MVAHPSGCLLISIRIYFFWNDVLNCNENELFDIGFIHFSLTFQVVLWSCVNCISVNRILCNDVLGNLQFT